MFGKTKTANDAQVAEMVNVLKVATGTADRTEQDAVMAKLDVMIDQLDNKQTLHAYREAAPILLVETEARHLAAVTGESLSFCQAKVHSLLTELLGTGKSYDVFWRPSPSNILSDIRVLSDRYVASREPTLATHHEAPDTTTDIEDKLAQLDDLRSRGQGPHWSV